MANFDPFERMEKYEKKIENLRKFSITALEIELIFFFSFLIKDPCGIENVA